MALLWGDLRTTVRRSLLKDEVETAYRWTEEELLDYCGWALDTLCIHTAVASGVTYSETTATAFALPDNIYDDIEITGEVFFQATGRVEYLDPIKRTEALSRYSKQGFYIWPADTLNILSPVSGQLTVRYFAHYPHPVDANSSLSTVPSRLVPALSYLIAAHAMSNYGLRSANIRQWGQKPDTGNPEHNPLMEQQGRFIKMYEWLISQHTPQDRPNFFREAR